MRQVVFAIATSFLVFISCSEKEQIVQGSESPNNGDIIERVVFEVPSIKDGDDAETKASAVPGDGVVDFAWDVLDTIGIYPDKGSQVYFTMESGAGTNLAEFDGGGWALKPKSQYSSYYPFVGDIYLSRDRIPISFSGQKQIGTVGPFSGARYCLASEPTSSVNGELRFTYNTLNTIINVNATLPAGTYTKAWLLVSDPVFVDEGTYSLDSHKIVGTKFKNKLEITLEDFVLAEDSTVPIYFMSAPIDLTGKEVVVQIVSSDSKRFKSVKHPSKPYLAGMRYGLDCVMEEVPVTQGNILFEDSNLEDALLAAFDTNGDKELSYAEASCVTSFDNILTSKGYVSFDEFRFFTSLTEIPDNCFYGQNKLRSISLPEGIKSVAENAFSGCTALERISIGSYLLSKNRMSYLFPDSYQTVSEIDVVNTEGEYSLTGYALSCRGLERVSLPEGLTKIGSYAFSNCRSLVSIDFPESLQRIDGYAFSNCESLQSLFIGDNVTIGAYAFNRCSTLQSAVFGCNVIVRGYAFSSCTSLEELSFPQEGVLFEGGYVFWNCTELKRVKVPNLNSWLLTIYDKNHTTGAPGGYSHVLSVGNPFGSSLEGHLFVEGIEVISVTIPEDIVEIHPYAFASCSSINEMIIPQQVEIIGKHAFNGCSGLSSVTVLAETVPIGDEGMFDDTGNCPIYVPEGSVEAFKAADHWSAYSNRIQAIPQ